MCKNTFYAAVLESTEGTHKDETQLPDLGRRH